MRERRAVPAVTTLRVGDHIIRLNNARNCRAMPKRFCRLGSNLCTAIRATQAKAFMPDGPPDRGLPLRPRRPTTPPVFHYMGLLDLRQFHRGFAGNRARQSARGPRRSIKFVTSAAALPPAIGPSSTTGEKVWPGANVRGVRPRRHRAQRSFKRAAWWGADKIVGIDNQSHETRHRREVRHRRISSNPDELA